MGSSRELFSQKSPVLDLRLGSKYASGHVLALRSQLSRRILLIQFNLHFFMMCHVLRTSNILLEKQQQIAAF